MLSHPTRARARRVTTIAASLLTLTAVLPAAAGAVAYTVRPCTAGTTPFAGSGLIQPDGSTTIDDRCAAGGGFQMTFTGQGHAIRYGVETGFRIQIPAAFPHAKILRVSSNITIPPRSGDASALYTIDETNGHFDPNGGAALSWPDTSYPQTGPFNVAQSPIAPSRSLIWRLESAGTTSLDTSKLGADFLLNGLNVDLDDSTSPLPVTLTNTGLLDGTPQSGKRILSLSGRDEDSGVHDITAVSGSTVLAVLDGGCTYVGVEACPTSRTGDLVVDTTKLPDGPQTLSIRTMDAATNVTTVQSPTILVANRTTTTTPNPLGPGATPPQALGPPNGNPKGTPIITAGTKSKKAPAKAQTVTVGQHRKVSLIGRLLAADGTPMPGAQVDLTQTIAIPGGATTKLDSVTTDAKGVYRYAFTPASSVVVAVRYPGHVGSADYAAPGRTVKVGLRAHLSFKQVGDTHRGTPMKFTGNIDAYPVPAGGIRIAIQYHSLKGGWLNADVITTRSDGNFSWKHTFRTAAKYRLRARFVADKRVAAAPNVSHELRFRLR